LYTIFPLTICWVEDAKQQKTRERRINRTACEHLEGKKRPCCWAGCIHRTNNKPGKLQQNVLIKQKERVSINDDSLPNPSTVT